MEIIGTGTLEMFLRLFVALILGVILGVERNAARKTAGMRTYGLVSMGSAAFVIISEILSMEYAGVTSFDPSRIAGQIVVGIGFIGAGLIIFKDAKIRGLTTAAGLWVSAGIGSAIGFGMYDIGIFLTALTLFVFSILWLVETRIKKIADDYREDDF